METKPEPRVEFAQRQSLAIAAVIAGAAIAIGSPAVVLGLGHDLTPTMQLWLTVGAIGVGGLTSLTAAFFGTVLPSSVGGQGEDAYATRQPAARQDENAMRSPV
jgi:hypothetical protein